MPGQKETILLLFLLGSCFCYSTYKEGIEHIDRPWTFNTDGSKESEFQNLLQQIKGLVPLAVLEDIDRTFEEIVASRGYPVESHQLWTEDGYNLTIFRIPYGKDGPSENRPVVLLQHGLLCSATDWIITGPTKSLVYLLANNGYDVWLGNARGNTFSRSHRTLDPNRDASSFWDFSWEEIGYYDIPAMIDYILSHTGQEKLFYAGHSQGTTVFYVMASMRPEYNDKIRAHFSLSPVVYMGNLFSPLLRMASVVGNSLHAFLQLVGMYEFGPSDSFLSDFAQQFCSDEVVAQLLCRNALFALCGFSTEQMNITLLPIMLGHLPAGAATKQLVHYGQLIRSSRFRRFDYGLISNRRTYGSLTPPNYDLSKVTAPVYFFYSRNDWMAAERDVLQLERELPNFRGKFLNPDPRWNHMDFIYGIDIDTHINLRVLSLMTRH